MRKLKYLLLFIFSMALFNSCVDDTSDLDLNDDGVNVVTFERISTSLTTVANGSEYTFLVKVKVVGPTLSELSNNVTVSATRDASSTATEGVHYRINNLPLTLTAADSYIGTISVTVLTEGNAPPMDGTPEFDEWVAPFLKLKLNVTGDPMVIGSGKLGLLTLNYAAPNPYAGDYTSELSYFHPTAGGVYPTEPFGGLRVSDKTLVPVTGRKAETYFGVWGPTEICWITIKADNSIGFEVAKTWTYDVKLGDPKDPTKVSHFDPETGKIYLYYYYSGTGGDRIFWEVFTPKE